MTLFSWLWIAWALAFCAVEGVGLAVKDRPGAPATLSAHISWLIQGAGLWHRLARVGVVCGLAWLSIHFLTGGWV